LLPSRFKAWSYLYNLSLPERERDLSSRGLQLGVPPLVALRGHKSQGVVRGYAPRPYKKHEQTLWNLVVFASRRHAASRAPSFFFIVDGLYSVTALREIDHERVTVYTKHRLLLQALVTEALGS